MHEEDKNLNPKSIYIGAKAASFLAAGSLAVLITLSLWKFELRSISRLLLQSSLLSVVIWLGLYFFFYQKLSNPIRFDHKTLVICAIASLFVGFQFTPQQGTSLRYVVMIAISSAMLLLINLSFLMALADREKIPWKTIFLVFAFICGLLGMLIIITNSFSVRMYADDFANAIKLESWGLWKSALWFYRSWSASFFSNFLIMGFSNQRWAPLIFLILILVTFYFSLLRIVKNNASIQRLTVLAGAFFIPFTIFTVTPDMYKSLYWISSSMALLPLLIMIPIYLVIISHLLSANQLGSRALLVIGMVLSFAISTTHEVASVGWLGMHVFGLIWFYLAGSKNIYLRNFLIAGLFAALTGIVIMLVSPGVDARIATQEYSSAPPVFEALLSTIRYFIDFIKMISAPIYIHHGDMRPGWFLIIAVAGLGWLTDTPYNRHMVKAALILILSIGMAAVSYFPGAYILGDTIPLRTQFIPSLYLVFGLYIFGLFLPRVSSKQLKVSLTILIMQIMLIGSFISISQLVLTIEPMRQYARDWDLRDVTVRTTSELPHRLKVPWDEYEQNLGDFRRYYRTR